MWRIIAQTLGTIACACLFYFFISKYTSFTRPHFLFIIAMIVIGNQVWRFIKNYSFRKDDKSQ